MEAHRELLFERWSVALDAANIGIWDWRIDTDEAIYDDRYYEMAGYAPGAFPPVYVEWRSRVHPTDIDRIENVLHAHLAGEIPAYDVEFRFRRADGEWMWISATGRIMERDAEGAPRRMVGIHLDVTELRGIEDQLRHSQRLDAVGRLAGGIAHDFNNMLSGILGCGELLAQQLEQGSEGWEFARNICRTAERAGRLTSNLLAFSRKGRRSIEVFDVRTEVVSVQELLSHTLPEDIRLTTEIGATGTFVEGDPVQVQSAILNLAVNARDAMPEGGELSIRTSRREIARDAASARGIDPGDYVQIEVADTGPGIESGLLDRIFDPYFTTKGRGEGTGLGLAAVYGTAREHGGQVQVMSEPGQGATFRLLLPASDGKPRVAAAAAPDSGEGVTVLVVDDEESVRQVTAAMLRRDGYTVLEAADGEESVAVYAERGTEIDVVVMDVSMPGLGGAGAFEAIRRLDAAARIILATGFVEGTPATDRIFAGRAGMLRKPFSRTDLLDEVQAALASGP